MIGKKNDSAVSPVIGVILMVAVTVILAAVIAAFVFSMAGNIQKTKIVSTTVSRVNSDSVAITLQGGNDAGSVKRISFIAQDPLGTDISDLTPTFMASPGTGAMTLGKTSTISSPSFTQGSHLIGIAMFTDGSTQIIFDTKI